MAITRIGANGYLTDRASTALSVPAPAGAAADTLTLVLFGALTTDPPASQPGDLWPIATLASGDFLTAALAYALGPRGDYTWSMAKPFKLGGLAAAYRGVDPTDPIGDKAFTETPAGRQHATPAITLAAGQVVLYGAVTRHRPGGAGQSTWTSDAPADPRLWEGASNAGAADLTICTFETTPTAPGRLARRLTSTILEDKVLTFAAALRPAQAPPGGDPGPGLGGDLRPGLPIF